MTVQTRTCSRRKRPLSVRTWLRFQTERKKITKPEFELVPFLKARVKMAESAKLMEDALRVQYAHQTGSCKVNKYLPSGLLNSNHGQTPLKVITKSCQSKMWCRGRWMDADEASIVETKTGNANKFWDFVFLLLSISSFRVHDHINRSEKCRTSLLTKK